MAARMTTPPPTRELPAMPQTPRWGTFEDNYEPYPRTRAATQKRANGITATPAPATPRKSVASGIKGKKPVYTGTAFSGGSSYTPPSTIAKKRTFKLSHLGDDVNAARDGSRSPTGFLSTSAVKSGMPSTPERTPRTVKKGMTKSDSNNSINSLGSISRNLFSSRLDDDDVFPSPRKHVKYGDVLGEVEEEEIHIFTDSKERIPEADISLKNPFYGPGRRISAAKGAKTKLKDRKGKKVATEVDEEKEEVGRTEGFWSVFRGKKIFKKYSEMEDADEDVRAYIDNNFAAELDASVPERFRGPITRSRDLKPRILFPTAAQIAAKQQKEKEEQSQHNTDEEADTDIEEVATAPIPKPKVVEKGLKTPRAVKISAPLSPPTTARTTRSKDVRSDDIASASFTSTGSHSQEFQNWQSAKPQGKKRDATSSSEIDVGNHKRIRSHAA